MKEHPDLLSGFLRLHVLHLAMAGEVHGLEMIEELGRHGYELSAGSLYPMLHATERRAPMPGSSCAGCSAS